MSTDGLRPTFYWINGVVYAIQVTYRTGLVIGLII
jgi:hypothetical protein